MMPEGVRLFKAQINLPTDDVTMLFLLFSSAVVVKENKCTNLP